MVRRCEDPADVSEITIPEAISVLNLNTSDCQIELLASYRDLLIDANRRLNLTAMKRPRTVDARLIAESLAIVPLIGPGPHRLLDVGTGGGIPGIPLAIACPDSAITLLDATAKKLEALDGILRELGIENVNLVHGRAEEVAHDAEHRGCYTVVVSRAVARLPTLVEYTLPFLTRCGVAILPKGRQVQRELGEARDAIATLGGELVDVFTSPINDARFVRIRQRRLSPARYPRNPGTPSRQPIGVSAR